MFESINSSVHYTDTHIQTERHNALPRDKDTHTHTDLLNFSCSALSASTLSFCDFSLSYKDRWSYSSSCRTTQQMKPLVNTMCRSWISYLVEIILGPYRDICLYIHQFKLRAYNSEPHGWQAFEYARFVLLLIYSLD